MRALLAELGDPQLAFPAIHVVGTNGKSTATITIEQLLLSEGLSVGATISPHVAELERTDSPRWRGGGLRGRGCACSPCRGEARRHPVRGRDRRRVRALRRSRGGGRSRRGGAGWTPRRDQRPADARRPAHERRARAHGRARGHRRGDRAREARGRAGGQHRHAPRRDAIRISSPLARSGSEVHAKPPRHSSDTPSLRTQRSSSPAVSSVAARPRSGTARTIPTVLATSSSGFHPVTTRSSCRYSRTRMQTRCFASFAARGRDLSRPGRRRRALCRRPSSPQLARAHFAHVESVDDPAEALARAHALGEPVLVTGSLYLLGDIAAGERE